jgi:hypothetical protein
VLESVDTSGGSGPEYLDLMLRRQTTVATTFVALICAAVVVCAQTGQPSNSKQVQKQTAATKNPAKTAKRGKKAKQPEENIIPQQPPPPPTPEQMPSVMPEVAYRDGMLTINAPNSTMNDVLSAVRRVTGATVEKPPVGGGDRVVAHLGPGQPKDVLESLFNGSRYDYIILGSMTRPGAVERIVLTARANSGPSTSVATNNQVQRPNPGVQQQPAEQEEPETDTEDMTVPERDQAEPEQQQPDQQQPQPGPPQGMPIQPPQEQTPQGQSSDQNQQPHVKSPDELLRELQQMQKQPPDQNQQQQEQPPPQ